MSRECLSRGETKYHLMASNNPLYFDGGHISIVPVTILIYQNDGTYQRCMPNSCISFDLHTRHVCLSLGNNFSGI